MNCNSCQCLVTQDEADMAAAIWPSENTYCEACAKSMVPTMYELAMMTPAGWDNDGYGEAVRSTDMRDIIDAAASLWSLGGDWDGVRFGLVTDDDWDDIDELCKKECLDD